MMSTHKTHFGFSEVTEEEKTQAVGDVFTRVASKYDVMNDFMSFGIHRLWKKLTQHLAPIRPGHVCLDVAAGTGDLTRLLAQRVGLSGCVYSSDINAAMLHAGRAVSERQGLFENIRYVQANAEQLPFPSDHFNAVTIGFGLRNVTHIPLALQAFYRVLKPGGCLLVLEFSKPNSRLLETIYDKYSFHVIPKIGEWVLEDSASYQYLVESIRMHPDQETLATMTRDAGFEQCDYFNLSGGIVALHRAFKY